MSIYIYISYFQEVSNFKETCWEFIRKLQTKLVLLHLHLSVQISHLILIQIWGYIIQPRQKKRPNKAQILKKSKKESLILLGIFNLSHAFKVNQQSYWIIIRCSTQCEHIMQSSEGSLEDRPAEPLWYPAPCLFPHSENEPAG